MFSNVISSTISGVNAVLVNVETDVSNGMPSFTITGIPSTEVRESTDRVRTAIRNSGYKIPVLRIVINLSPAGVRKSGTALDLPIAVGILSSAGIISCDTLEQYLIIGELGLNGSIHSVNGVLASVITAQAHNIKKCIVPLSNVKEARQVDNMQIYGAATLSEVVNIINEETDYHSTPITGETKENTLSSSSVAAYGDFNEIYGQYSAKRASLIAAAGRHNLLFIGPPGSGKTMLASRIPGIMPQPDKKETMEISRIYSVAGLLDGERGIKRDRPFRAPHNNITRAGLVGGGSIPVPGEVTLAHRGVLFLDELPLYNTEVLESLRIPLEKHEISVMRKGCVTVFPADFLFIAAMNPCKCGYYPDRNRCHCTDIELAQYAGRLSRPLLDRFDMSVRVDKPKYDEIAQLKKDDSRISSDEMRKMVTKAVKIQQERFTKENKYEDNIIRDNILKDNDSKGTTTNIYNGMMTPFQIKKYCKLNKECTEYIRTIYDKYNMTARGYHKLLKVARTIADLDGKDNIEIGHIMEACIYRSIDTEGEGYHG